MKMEKEKYMYIYVCIYNISYYLFYMMSPFEKFGQIKYRIKITLVEIISHFHYDGKLVLYYIVTGYLLFSCMMV